MASPDLLPPVSFPSLYSPGTLSSGEDSGETLVNPLQEGSDSDWAPSSDPLLALKGHTGVQPTLKSTRSRLGKRQRASISRPTQRKGRKGKKKADPPQEHITQDMDVTLEFDENLPAWVTEPPPPEWTLPHRPRCDSTGRVLPPWDSEDEGESTSDEDDEPEGAPSSGGMHALDQNVRERASFRKLMKERQELDFLYINPLSPQWFPAEDGRNPTVAQKNNRGR